MASTTGCLMALAEAKDINANCQMAKRETVFCNNMTGITNNCHGSNSGKYLSKL